MSDLRHISHPGDHRSPIDSEPDHRAAPLGTAALQKNTRKSVPFVVRTAMPADTAALDALFRASFSALLKQDYSDTVLQAALPILVHTSPRLIGSGTYFVAETGDGELIGAGGWTQATPFGGVGPREVGHMRRLGIHPDYARCGVGSVVLSYILDNARLTGVTRMCSLSTLSARAFYAHHGFDSSGDVELTLKPGVNLPAVQMGRDL